MIWNFRVQYLGKLRSKSFYRVRSDKMFTKNFYPVSSYKILYQYAFAFKVL